MANQIKAPINYPVIAGGKIVAGGSVLFGQPNVKPDEDNPSTLKAVYLDAALTQPAQNPQGLSSDGVFDQSDTGILFGPENTVYSIVIKGANKRELSYIPEYDLSDSNAAATAQDAAAAAASSEANALSFKNLTEALYADFTNRYFGPFSSDPSVDDLGNPPSEGSIYFNSTSNVFFTWTDGAWVNHFPSNPNGLLVTATGTDTPRTLGDRFADVVSIKDYGAVESVDCSTQFQNAVDSGKSVFIPKGTWILSKAIRVKQGDIEIFGEQGSVIATPNLERTGGVPSHPLSNFYSVFVIMDETLPYSTVLENITIRDFEIDQTGLKNSIVSGVVCRTIESHNTKNLVIKNITASVIGQFSSARYSENLHVYRNTIQSLSPDAAEYADAVLAAWDTINGAKYHENVLNGTDPDNGISTLNLGGFSLSGGTEPTSNLGGIDISITNNTIKNMNRFGIWMDGRNDYHRRVLIDGNTVVSVEDAGIRLEDLDGFLLSNNIISATGGSGIVLQKSTSPDSGNGCHNGVVQGNNLYNNDGRAIIVEDSSSNITLQNNLITETTGLSSFESQIILGSNTQKIVVKGNEFNTPDDVKVINSGSNPRSSVIIQPSITVSSGISSLSSNTQIKQTVYNNIVQLDGYIGDITPSGSNNFTAVNIPLPIPLRADLQKEVWVSGHGTINSSAGVVPCFIQGTINNSTALLSFISPAASAGIPSSARFSITYPI